MLLVKEDGSGLEGANTYALPEDVDPYAQIYNWTTWLNTTDAQSKESACARATMFLDLFPNLYGKLNEVQTLTFPLIIHEEVELEKRIPKNLKLAHAIAANIELENPNSLLRLEKKNSAQLHSTELKNVTKKQYFKTTVKDWYPLDASPIIFQLMKVYLPQYLIELMGQGEVMIARRFYK